jgi:quinoprotein glucose dehydrogenase
MVGREDFAKHMLTTDVDFGVDGGIYFSDWVQGWAQPLKGRVYRVHAPALAEDALIAETKAILAAGFAERSTEALAALLSHADQRVRLEAQYALADREEAGMEALRGAAQQGVDVIPRLHGLWGLWQRALAGENHDALFIALLEDQQLEVRAWAAQILGDIGATSAAEALIARVSDSAPRVAFFAAGALRKMPQSRSAHKALVQLLRDNDNQDAYLRHAAVIGLVGQGDVRSLGALRRDSSAAARLGAVLALRRLGDGSVGRFLDDKDPFVRLEAARAIHDEVIVDALPALAAYADSMDAEDLANPAMVRRVINAHLLVAGEEEAEGLAAIARREDVATRERVEALDALAVWGDPPVLDRVTGAWRPVKAGNTEDAHAALARVAVPLLSNAPLSVRVKVAELVGQYKVYEAEGILLATAFDESGDSAVRRTALHSLAMLDSPLLGDALAVGLASTDESVRLASLEQLASTAPAEAVPLIRSVLAGGSAREQQVALRALADMEGEAAVALTLAQLDKLMQGDVAAEVMLDVLHAARSQDSAALAEKFAAYEAGLGGNTLAAYRPALYGGNADAGRDVFFEKTAVSCLRCHARDGKGGEEVGPDLMGLGARVSREYILEAIVAPNAAIAAGYESVLIYTKSGEQYAGYIVGETGRTLKLEMPRLQYDANFSDDGFGTVFPHSVVDVVAEGSDDGPQPDVVRLSIKKRDIAEQRGNISAMPTGLVELLTPDELRDLVEFLHAGDE